MLKRSPMRAHLTSAPLCRLGARARGPRLAQVLLGLTLVGGILAHSDQAEATPDPPFSARMECRSSGRLVACVVALGTPHPGYISWGEARVASYPPFVKPVLERAEYFRTPSTRPLIKLALIPKHQGEGTLVVKLRAIVCKDSPACPWVTRTLSTKIRVDQ